MGSVENKPASSLVVPLRKTLLTGFLISEFWTDARKLLSSYSTYTTFVATGTSQKGRQISNGVMQYICRGDQVNERLASSSSRSGACSSNGKQVKSSLKCWEIFGANIGNKTFHNDHFGRGRLKFY